MTLSRDFRESFKRISKNEFVRFVFVGAVNTGSTYVLYALLALFLDYSIAYTLSYLVGIVIAYVLNARLVFNEPLRFSKAILYPIVYVVQYLFGLFLLRFLIDMLGLDKFLAPFVVIILSLPLTFVMNRLVLKGSIMPPNV